MFVHVPLSNVKHWVIFFNSIYEKLNEKILSIPYEHLYWWLWYTNWWRIARDTGGMKKLPPFKFDLIYRGGIHTNLKTSHTKLAILTLLLFYNNSSMHNSNAHLGTITFKPLTIFSENNSRDVKELVLDEKVHLRMLILILARTDIDKYISPHYLKLVNIFPIFLYFDDSITIHWTYLQYCISNNHTFTFVPLFGALPCILYKSSISINKSSNYIFHDQDS